MKARMSKLFAFLLISVFSLSAIELKANDGPIYLFSFKYFKNSFNHQLGLTFFTNFTRSPQLGSGLVYTPTKAYPVPIYTYVYSLGSISYEPQFRLIEFGNSQSISLNTPITLGASVVGVRVSLSETSRWDYEPVSDSPTERSFGTSIGYLGLGHAEFGIFGSYNLGRYATDENTWPIGVNLAVGYNYTYGPIYIENTSINRSDYSDYLRWGQLVGRLGLQLNSVGFSYALGLDQTTVQYFESSTGSRQYLETSVYHKLTMTFNL